MATIIPAVITEDARLYWPQVFAGLLGVPSTVTVPGVSYDPRIKLFRVGEGGWIDPGTGKVRRQPDPTLRYASGPLAGIQGLDAEVDSVRVSPRYEGNQLLPTYSRGVFQKALTLADFTSIAPNKIEVSCLLDFGEANEDYPGSGRNPEFWEIGLYADHPITAGAMLLVAYGTFAGQTKSAGVQRLNKVRIAA